MSLKHVFIIILFIMVAPVACAINSSATLNDTIRFEDGAIYYGEIADSLFNGYGKMIYADSTIYIGNWKEGLWDGEGELFFPDGDYYKGNFSKQEFSGYGVYHYANGAKYDGYWANGMFNGAGTMEYADGGIYAGEWKDDMRHGIGVLHDQSTGNLYKGEFVDDQYCYPQIEDDEITEYDSDIPDFSYYPNFTTVSITYGSGQMFTLHIGARICNRYYAGIAIGLNTLTQEIGKPSVVTNEHGERVTLVGWNSYKNEILTEMTYPLLKTSGEFGFCINRFAIGTALGIGVEQSVRNCRSLSENDSYFAPGTLYYRTKFTGVKLTYDIFAEYSPNLQLPYFDIALRTGFSNIDRLYLGIGVIF